LNNVGVKTTRAVYLIDRIILGYCLLMTALLLLLGRPIGEYLGEIVFYIGMAVLVVVIVRYCDESTGGWSAFLRLLYPGFMFTLFYRVTGGQMFLIFDQFLDAGLVSWEHSLFGENPTIYIDRELLNVWVTELLSFCYFCYYLMIPGFLTRTFLRKEYRIIRQYLAAASLTFFASYLLFWLYPIEGPRWFFADQYINSVEGPFFRQLVELVIDNGAVRGGAMPSSHTGVALVTLIFCFRYFRKAGWILLPIVTGLSVGTVWGRFHYVSDVLVGALLGVAAVWLVWRYYDQTETIGSVNQIKEMRTDNAS